MSGLPRAIIKKYGVSKKAWSVYRAGKRKSKPAKTRSVNKMARRKRASSKRTYRRKRKTGLFSSNKILGLGTKGLIGGFGLLGVGLAGLFSDDIAKMIPIDLPMKEKMVAFAIAGPAGAAASFAADALGVSNKVNFPAKTEGTSGIVVFGQ